ncbi:MAG TPA: carbon monoxide dehydrogenase subunit G [Candidatus Acidoferrales bacterium]|nr:carbon monoxide dehydrogenase subunit G [Candidatus Acidoferrales bacterium]
MQINFGGDFTVKKPIEEVYSFLTDANQFCPLLPDFKSMKKEDERHFVVTVRVGVSHIRGDAKLKMELLETQSPSRAVYQGKGDVLGGTATLTAGFNLEKAGAGTKVIWKGESQIVGRMASLAGGLLEPLAKKNVEKLIQGLQNALE